MQETKTDRLNIRIEESLKNQLKESADKEGRTVANLVTHIVKEWLINNHSNKKTDLSGCFTSEAGIPTSGLPSKKKPPMKSSREHLRELAEKNFTDHE
jgi:hypothetical protein